MIEIYLRPLKHEDALISYMWRNDKEIWEFTENKPDRHITVETEIEWIKTILQRPNELRFAICIKDTDQYIGNVQLTDLTASDAQFHIFIGEKAFWGKGLGRTATKLLLEYSGKTLKLKSVYLFVRKDNLRAVSIYRKCGFEISASDEITYKMTVHIGS